MELELACKADGVAPPDPVCLAIATIAEAILIRTSAEQVPSLHRVAPCYLKPGQVFIHQIFSVNRRNYVCPSEVIPAILTNRHRKFWGILYVVGPFFVVLICIAERFVLRSGFHYKRENRPIKPLVIPKLTVTI